MSVCAVGYLKREVTFYDVHRYVKETFDPDAQISVDPAYNFAKIIFEYRGEQRHLSVTMDCIDGREITGEDTITSVSLDCCGIAGETIEYIVAHFGGWYIPCDSDRDCGFYEFTEHTPVRSELEQRLYEMLDKDMDMELKLKIVQFVANNLDKIKALNPA